jgi:hypothetical protein
MEENKESNVNNEEEDESEDVLLWLCGTFKRKLKGMILCSGFALGSFRSVI